jgi:hypothetical protein
VSEETIRTDGSTPTYRCVPEIIWTRDVGRVLLIDTVTRQAWSLRGFESAIWDWLTLGHDYGKITQLLSLLANVPEAEACRMFLAVLTRWWDSGIVERLIDTSHGESVDHRAL